MYLRFGMGCDSFKAMNKDAPEECLHSECCAWRDVYLRANIG